MEWGWAEWKEDEEDEKNEPGGAVGGPDLRAHR